MKKNVGAFDGWFRILVFIIALCYAVMDGTLVSWLLVIPGAILFLTAIAMWCPLYAILGLDTNAKGKLSRDI